MNKRIRTYIEVVSHLLIWALPTYLIIRHNMMSFEGLTGKTYHLPLLFSVFLNIVIVYSNIFILYPAFIKKRFSLPQYFLILLLVVLITAVMKVKADSQFIRYYTSVISATEHGRFWMELIVNSFFAIQSVLYCIVKEWIRNKIIGRKLVEEKLSLELRYLKSQINPHFLFNTLNNLYSVALKNNDDETASGITKLSQIMRFMLDEVNENLIHLEKEINYLRSYIDLQMLRFSEKDDIKINFDADRDKSDIMIPPFIFIVFIENAFKYGINISRPSFIDIRLAATRERIKFSISNSIQTGNERSGPGIGLRNIRERLELIYPGRYDLEITSENDIFHVDLTLRLNSGP